MIYIEFYQGMLHLNIHMGNCDVKSVIVFLREEKPCMRAFMKRVAAVSYTHLDVYKRQSHYT